MWEPSSSAEENWSDADGGNENGEWPIKGIVGEEVDSSGILRFEVRWTNWQRANNTNTTWTKDLADRQDLVRQWKRRQKTRRGKLAKESLDILIHSGLDIHNTDTILRAQAYDEKLSRRIGLGMAPVNSLEQQLEILKHEKEGLDNSAAPHRPMLRQSTARQQQPHTTPSSAKSFRSASTTSSMSSLTLVNSAASVQTGKSSTPGPSPSKVQHNRPQAKVAVPEPEPPNPQVALQKKWRKAAQLAGAASISIVNNVDDEQIPNLWEYFEYCERRYLYDKDVLRMEDANCFVFCECKVCEDASNCNCQDPSELLDDDECKEFAYTEQGLFTFNVPQGVEVIECNKYCSCDRISCRNRVAQRPRDTPIEVFKTEGCGWGARATVDLKRGKVLGLYTGLLVRRATAENLPLGLRGYCFDLDGNEDQDEEIPENSYSVDSNLCGNWTRFVNHSCDPNTRVYAVVYDTIPEMNMPYLAFVTTRDIPARTELTVDYDPAAARRIMKGKGKGKLKMPANAKTCRCGSTQCRGWLS